MQLFAYLGLTAVEDATVPQADAPLTAKSVTRP